jgi:twitching motility protein PilT
MTMEEILRSAVEQGTADIFMIAGMPVAFRIGGIIKYQGEQKLFPADLDALMKEFYHMANDRSMEKVLKTGDDDFSMALPGCSRFRANVFRQRGSLAAVIRVITFDLPDYHTLGIPQSVIDISRMTKGFVLVTGPAGSGKSTTLACIIDEINKTKNAHVITLEDPIEYLHRHNKSVVTQREIITDTESYVTGLRAALRQAPDVILVGEMRDEETIKTAMTAAETGHLVISTLHTVGAANTIDRIIDTFPPNQQNQVRSQLAMVMQAVVSQQLIPGLDGKEYPAYEIMFFNNAIRNLIRESKVHQLDNMIATSHDEGMVTMDNSLMDLYQRGLISKENAIVHSNNSELMEKKLARL